MNKHANKLFSKIETRAVLKDGRTVASTCSYPLGASYEVYRQKDEDLVKSFGSYQSKTIGTFLGEEGQVDSRTLESPQEAGQT